MLAFSIKSSGVDNSGNRSFKSLNRVGGGNDGKAINN